MGITAGAMISAAGHMVALVWPSGFAYGAGMIGTALLAEAAKRVLAAGESIGVRGLVVHALNDDAAAFYRGLGFEAAAGHPLTLMVPLSRLRASL